MTDAYAKAKAEFLARYRYASRAMIEAVSTGLDTALKYNASIDRERTRGALAGVRELLVTEEECPFCQGPLNRDGSCAASCVGVGDAV